MWFLGKSKKIHPNPVLILGNQKSGTTAIAKLLAMAGREKLTQDIRPMWEPTLSRLKKGDLRLQDLAQAYPLDFSRKIIKEPNLTFFYPQLTRLFPNGRFVFIVRDPRDNIRSILNRLQLPGSLPDLRPERLADMDFHWRHLFRDVYEVDRQASYIVHLAKRWQFCTDVYLNHRPQMILVRYEDFLQDKKAYIDQLTVQCGLKVKRNIAPYVDIPFQPKGNHSVAIEDFFGEENLKKILAICKANMLALDYKL